MTYPQDFEARLGFDQVRQRIHDLCAGPLGKKQLTTITFHHQLRTLEPLLKQTFELLHLMQEGEDIPLNTYDDPLEFFQTASIDGNFLEGESFLKIAKGLQVAIATNDFLLKRRDQAPFLFTLTLPDHSGKKILKSILDTLDDEGNVRDNASPELNRIRKKLKEEVFKVRRAADQIIRKALDQGWTAEGSHPTIRDGRLVIPVLAEHKRKIKGYIIDQSATGQTVYLEPGEVMEANNDLRELELEERKEVVRILKNLTSLLKLNLGELESCYGFIGRLDFTRAKAKYARMIDAGLPVIQETPCLNWIDARHPLLFLSLKEKRHVVPLTIDLKEGERFLLVSGPNAGGKSVCLKTVGLIQYMLQCGLLVPLSGDSTMGMFGKIFLDIGDQQSIENDLSTYSSHLKNMDFFTRNASENTLVLMDELGSGTDPNFGGGIAQAILTRLIEVKAWGVVTTHYYNLKVFAVNFPGIRNAAMKFDTDKLVPLFQLEIGQPGSSFALEIARKTGLAAATIQAAEKIIGKDLTGLETLMKQVAEQNQRLTKDEAELEQKERQLAATLKRYEDMSAELEKRKKDILNNARTEASSLLQETNREIEKTIRHIRENKAEKTETRKIRKGLKEMEKKVKPIPSVELVPVSSISIGDKVRISGSDVTGTVLSIKGKTVMVQFGDLRSSVKIEKLVRSDQLDKPKEKRSAAQGIGLHQRQLDFSPVLDMRGLRLEEVVPRLMHFIDDAVILGLSEAKIIHGKGGGVLRKAVRDYLKKQKSVSAISDEHADRGGDGVTLVKFS